MIEHDHEEQVVAEQHESAGARAIRSHQFVTMVVAVIGISFFLVFVALSLYRTSGTLQLDLSRPGYASAREELTKGNETFEGFSEDGPINADTLKEFDELYKQKAAEALIDIDAFSGNALSDKALALDKD